MTAMAIAATAVAAQRARIRRTDGADVAGKVDDVVVATVGPGGEKSGTYLPGWYAMTNSLR